ncbi:ABC transporter ATP-binding protein [Bauldia sp.]|uniref:ABC transporter ATP-binding protein n=1 Tax=Bauldia sp. TaxID=2575872 RepID=UPI003BAC0E1E
MAGLNLTSVVKRYGPIQVIHGVEFDIADGEFCVFVGPSGCGKSTLLRMIAGLEEISGGTIKIGDTVVNNVDPAKRGVAMVFQTYALYPHMTVAENMGFGLRMNGVPKDRIRSEVDKAARILQLEDYLERTPRALSGGQRQRVAIGRAIVRHPEVFLFDEPLSNLDAELRVQMRVEIAKLHQGLGNTMIYVTHDQVEAMTLADKIVVLRQGVVEQIGSPLDLYGDPENRFVAGFIGSPKMNFLSAVSRGAADGGIRVVLPKLGDAEVVVPLRHSAPEPGADLTLGIRPEHIQLGEQAGFGLEVTADVTEQLGGTSFVYANSGDDEAVVIEQRGTSQVRPGETVRFSFAPTDSRIFDIEGNRVR